MADKVKLVYEEVVQAVHEVIRDGRLPSERNVRARLGRGSASTVLTHLQTWRASEKDQPLATDHFSMELIVALRAEIATAEAKAVTAHCRENEILKEDLANVAQELVEKEARLCEMLEKNANLERDLAQRSGEIEAMKQENRRMSYHLTEWTKAQGESSKLIAKYSGKHQELIELVEGLRQQINELKNASHATAPIPSVEGES